MDGDEVLGVPRKVSARWTPDASFRRVITHTDKMPARIQYGSEREKGKGVILKRVQPHDLIAEIARGVGGRGRLSGPVPVEGVRWWRRGTGSAVWQGQPPLVGGGNATRR